MRIQPSYNQLFTCPYSFQDMEHDDELKGDGNSYTTQFRQYDPRLGRWLGIDPLSAKFPWQSPYVAFDNNPVFYKDPKGTASEGQEQTSAGPGDRKLRLTNKASQARAEGKEKKAGRIQDRIDRLNNSSKGQFKENRGMTKPLANGGNYKENSLTNTGAPDDEIVTVITDDAPLINTIGYRAAVINGTGGITVIQIGTPVFTAGTFQPQWQAGNALGQPANSVVQSDAAGNILDNNNPSNILIPILPGVDPRDGYFMAGENVSRIDAAGAVTTIRVATNDTIERYFITQKITVSGTIVETTESSKIVR